MTMTKHIGLPWYHEADYNGLQDMFEDGKLLPLSFHHWLENAQGLLEFLESQGVTIEKVYITPEDFPAWCGERDLRLNNRGRIEFVKFVLASSDKDTAEKGH